MGRRLAALVLCVLLLGATGLAVGGCGRKVTADKARTEAALQDVENTLDELETVLGQIEQQAREDMSGD